MRERFAGLAGMADAGAFDKDAAGARGNKVPAGAQARLKRPKIRPPQREGWIDVYEELTRVAFLEADRHEYQRKWVLLRDCWMYLYDSQEDVSLGREAETVLSIDLHGSLCMLQPKLERTFFLESSALYTVHGHKHRMLFRTAAEEDVQPWVSDINESAIWDMVLRAAASSVSQKAAARGKLLRGARGGTDASSVSARSAVSSDSAGTKGSSSSVTSRASGVNSFAASLSSSLSSFMGSRSSKDKPAKRSPLDSGARPRQRTGLADLPEDELATAEGADARTMSGGDRKSSLKHNGAFGGGKGDAFAVSQRGSSLGSIGMLSAPRPLESAALPLGAEEEKEEEEEDDFSDAFVATDVPMDPAAMLTPRSQRSDKSSSASVRCQQLPPAQANQQHLSRKADERANGRDARALLEQSRQVLEHARQNNARQNNCSTKESPYRTSSLQNKFSTEQALQHARPMKQNPPPLPPLPPPPEQRGTTKDLGGPAQVTSLLKNKFHTKQVLQQDMTKDLETQTAQAVSISPEVPEDKEAMREHGGGRGGGGGGGDGGRVHDGGGRGLGLGNIYPDARFGGEGWDRDRDEGSIDPRLSVCGRSESGFSILDDVVTQYSQSEAPSDEDGDFQDSDVDDSDNERVARERHEFFREAFCVRGSDSEEDLADLDQKLEARDAFESRIVRVRRVRRFYRRKVAVAAAPWTWGSGFHWCYVSLSLSLSLSLCVCVCVCVIGAMHVSLSLLSLSLSLSLCMCMYVFAPWN